ncbi:MAG TPA: hypothetical protein VE975_03180, partial [Actinomycetota bacterium]|nr:hypothetical protein [Actinomycetota bacterium]
AAQMARGMLGDVSRKLTQQFADCLETKMGAAPAPATAAEQTAAAASQPAAPAAPKTPERKAEPVRGASLLVTALAGSLRRLLQRVLSARKSRS